MIEYAKVILPKVVCFDQDFFKKELVKCVNWSENILEYEELENWVYQQFGDRYSSILDDVFKPVCFSLI